MARAKTKQSAVLLAIRDRLISEISGKLNASTCFLSLRPVPPTNPQGGEFITICPMDGSYNEGVFEGAGQEFLEENTGVIVTIFSRIRTDRNDHATEMLTDATRGVLEYWKPAILKALAEWEPTDGTDEILVNQMMPRSCQAPDTGDEGLIGLSIYFDTDFDWNLD